MGGGSSFPRLPFSPFPTPVTIFTPMKCQELGRQYGIVPGPTDNSQTNWGTFPAEMQQSWNKGNCNNQMCNVWKTQYNVELVDDGFKIDDSYLPSNIKEIWDQRECPKKVFRYDGCSNKCKVSARGRAAMCPAVCDPRYFLKDAFTSSTMGVSAPTKLPKLPKLPFDDFPPHNLPIGPAIVFTLIGCQTVGRKFGIDPGKVQTTWGTLPTSMQQYWNNSNCVNEISSSIIYDPIVPIVFTYPLGCKAVGQDFGIIPGIYQTNWGTFPDSMQQYWKDSNCDELMCQVWQSQYDITSNDVMTDNVTLKLPAPIGKAWDQLNCTSNIFAYTCRSPPYFRKYPSSDVKDCNLGLMYVN